MKRFALIGMVMAALAAGLVGCEWSTGEDATSWSSSYNWVNFSGTYRGATGGLLVTDFTTTPSIPGVTNTITVANETQGSFTAGQTSLSGKLRHGNVVPGSVVITLYNGTGGIIRSFSDNGSGVLGSGQGNVQYTSGSWNLSLTTDFPTVPGTVRANYSYTVSNSGSTGGGAESGATRVEIYSFNVTHSGQNLTIVDNNGATFSGKISQIRSTSGAENTDIPQVSDDETAHRAKSTYYESELPADGDSIIANFEASGISAAYIPVKIVGTLEGTVAAGVFTGRKMNGTWIEAGGKTGDINATTDSVVIQTTTTEPAATETATP
ncbi:MAG TPA: hypothetical protein P5204_11080 [Kiritimatiellia bacterium]|nr:hypothetical protein [Kiritimatiellia bacterium]